MTLREESGNGPPAGPETGGQLQELPTQQQEPPGPPQEPATQSQESPAHPRETAPPVPPPREEPSRLKVPPPREAPFPPEVLPQGEAPPPLAAAAPPQAPAAVPGPPGGHTPPAEHGPRTGPASPGSGPPRRRRSLATILIGGFAAVGLIGLGTFAAVLLLHGRAHAPPSTLPSVFRLRIGDCLNSGPGGISSPTVVPCSQPHDAEVYARFALAGQRWPGGAAIGTQARRGCTARLGGYLNPQLATTVLAESYVFPDQGAWNAGERTIICEIRSTAGKLTGSVRGLS